MLSLEKWTFQSHSCLSPSPPPLFRASKSEFKTQPGPPRLPLVQPSEPGSEPSSGDLLSGSPAPVILVSLTCFGQQSRDCLPDQVILFFTASKVAGWLVVEVRELTLCAYRQDEVHLSLYPHSSAWAQAPVTLGVCCPAMEGADPGTCPAVVEQPSVLSQPRGSHGSLGIENCTTKVQAGSETSAGRPHHSEPSF